MCELARQRGMRGKRAGNLKKKARHLKTREELTTRSKFSFLVLFAVRPHASSVQYASQRGSKANIFISLCKVKLLTLMKAVVPKRRHI